MRLDGSFKRSSRVARWVHDEREVNPAHGEPVQLRMATSPSMFPSFAFGHASIMHTLLGLVSMEIRNV